ncbi:hypothetical protein EG329_011054, partial [Mollisiaceae sp. DMI_Dod_QoI]
MEPLSDPFGSSPPPDVQIDSPDLGELPNRPTEPTLPSNHLPRASNPFDSTQFDFSSDPLAAQPPFPNRASAALAAQSRKRGPSSPVHSPHTDKNPRTSPDLGLDQSSQLVLQARDLLVRAYTVTGSRDKQARLLDLLEVFREYTEQGR